MTTNDTPTPESTSDTATGTASDVSTDTIIDDGSGRTDQTGFVPPPPPPPPPPAGASWHRTPVARDPDNGKLGGVIAGLSRSFGFDLRTTRIAVVVATLVLPVLIAVYGAAWLLLPPRPDEAVPLADVVRDRRRLPLLIAIGIVVLAGGIGSFGSWFLFGGIPWGLGLIAIGVLLWAAPSILDHRGDRVDQRADRAARRVDRAEGRTARSGTAADTTSFPAATGTWAAPVPADAPRTSTWSDSPSTFSGSPTARTSLPPLVTVQRARRRRRPVHAVGLIAAMTYVLLAVTGDALDWWNVPVLNGILITLAILWVTHALAGIVNHRWSVLPGLFFFGAIGSALLITSPNLDGWTGTRDLRPVTVAEAGVSHRLGIGEMTVDLTKLTDATSASTFTVRAEVGIGRLAVQVPDDVILQIHSTLGAGHVVLDGDEIADGIRHDDDRTELPADGSALGATTRTIVLDVEVGVGEISIERTAVQAVAG